MIRPVPPAIIYILGALILPLLPGRRAKQILALLIPVAAFIDLLYMPAGVYWSYPFLNYELVLARVDKLSLVFAYIFVIISFLSILYALHIREYGQHVAAYLYVGSSLGVVFAGDLVTLFICWEIMAAASVFLIWYARSQASLDAGFRYILVHLVGRSLLMAGIVMQVTQTGSIEFSVFDYSTTAAKFILAGFLINAAVPPLHAWLPDAYPEGTITGSVFMTAFTTKSAVYVLARSFAGLEILVWLGAVMTIYGVVYAVLEKDLRRLLAYHIVSQVGYMVCGVGLGSQMAINGASAHAFCHILYKALLFMGAGAVIHATGKRKMSDLQGHALYRSMPLILAFYMVGAFSISAVPLFNGFISKTMVVAAAGKLDRPAIELMLHVASIGTFLSVALKLPWGTWFGRAESASDETPRVGKTPLNMLLAMGLTSFICIFTGIYPKPIYDLLPYAVDFHPYDAAHVVASLQLLLLTAAAFWVLIDKLMAGPSGITLDTDWFYRISGRALLQFCNFPLQRFSRFVRWVTSSMVDSLAAFSRDPLMAIEKRLPWFPAGDASDQDLAESPQPAGDRHFPIGWTVSFSLLFLFLYGFVFLELFAH